MIGVACVLLLVLVTSTASIRPSDNDEGDAEVYRELSVNSGGKIHWKRPREEKVHSVSYGALTELRTKLHEGAGKARGHNAHRRIVSLADTVSSGRASAATVNGTGEHPSLLQSSLRHKHKQPTSGEVKPVDLVIFFGSVYAILGIVYLVCFKTQDVFKVNASRALRQVAFLFWRHARVAPMISSAVLYVIADFAVTPTSDSSWPIALAGSGALFNAVWHRWFYEWLDNLLGEGEGWWSGFKKVVAMQFLHTVVYLPLGILGWMMSLVFLYRAASDATNHCTASMLAAIPTNLEVSTEVAGAQLANAFESSVLFWPMSNIINFSIIQMWSPAFRTTWDGIMVVLWNLYVSAGGDDPAAVGPVLADIQTIAQQQTDASADCAKDSFTSIAEATLELTYWILTWIAYIIEQIAIYTQEFLEFCREQTEIFLHWLWENIKLYSWLTWCLICRKTWESWCVFCFIVRWLYIVFCKVCAEACAMSWKLWCLPFQMFDRVKWYCGLFFVPQLFNYEPCPCPTGEFEYSWVDVGVIWDGDYLFAPTPGSK